MVRVAVLPGDDAAPEAVHPTLDVLKALDLPLQLTVLPDGQELVRLERSEREELVRATVDACDTALFGATSGKTGGVGYLRWGKRTYANVRPVRYRPGLPSPLKQPEGIDYVIVRENLEDVYTGIEGTVEELRASGLSTRPYTAFFGGGNDVETSKDGRFAVKLITRENTENAARFSFELARRRRHKLTIACKWNILPRTDGFFRDVVREIAAGYPDVELDDYLADDFARRLVASPHDLDVVLLPNLYGDILSDEGAATVGGLGVCPSGCYGDEYAYFEPVHGTAPDIAGRGIINPIATLLTAAMMLEHLGFAEASRRLEGAVDATIAAGDHLTPDLGGTGTTSELAAAVRSRL